MLHWITRAARRCWHPWHPHPPVIRDTGDTVGWTTDMDRGVW